MPLTTNLDAMVEAVQRTANVLNFTDAHPVTRIKDLINQGLGALSRLCRTTNPEFQPVASVVITTDGSNTVYGLPSDFRSLLSVEYTDGNQHKHWLIPFELSERASLTQPNVTSLSLRAMHYRIEGTNIELLPRPPANHSALLWYATTVTQLAGGPPSPVWDTMERLDSYVIWWAAREIAMEREAWERHDRLSSKLSDLEADIRILARSKDLSHPARIVEVYPHRAAALRHHRYLRYGR